MTYEFVTTLVMLGRDVLVLKNPEKPDDYLVRRLAATEYEMASIVEKDESFVLEKDQCWVVAGNGKLKAKEAIDSRTFGPIHITNIVGRVLYCMRSAGDHNRVRNSFVSMHYDSPVLEVELNVDEMAKSHKA
ncbi:peptidase S24/S26A/S26B/S26C family protein [Medicago truncatula]|uniref:Peptidase S24/S26A/S26B/S26C family protein n=1 Tax=Medicago truncatula TaxID=3880 RepID=A0A072VL24_MEDTR|nr:peptidase S24/S26A/S26B/S26C family protein [Medicago truncatula]